MEFEPQTHYSLNRITFVNDLLPQHYQFLWQWQQDGNHKAFGVCPVYIARGRLLNGILVSRHCEASIQLLRT